MSIVIMLQQLSVLSIMLLVVLAMEDTEEMDQIRFVDGGECYGRLEMLHGINIASRGPYGQACTRDTSDADIQVVCRQLGCDPEGALRVDPVQFGFSSAIDTYSPFAFVCNGDETDLEACPRLDRIPGPPCYADEAASAIAIVCGGLSTIELPEEVRTETTEVVPIIQTEEVIPTEEIVPTEGPTEKLDLIRFVEGGECYGRLEMLHGLNIANRGPYGQACTRDTSDADIQVVCRQLGCDPVGALRVDPVQFGFSSAIDTYSPFAFVCTGDETDLEACPRLGGTAPCYADEAASAIAIVCGGLSTIELPEEVRTEPTEVVPIVQTEEVIPTEEIVPTEGPTEKLDLIRFVEGGECYGRLEMLHGLNLANRGPYGQACTRDTSDADIQVVCRQLGCDPVGAVRVNPVQFGFSSAIDIYSPFAFVCNGDETDLEACPRLDRTPGPPCYADEAASAIAIICGGLEMPTPLQLETTTPPEVTTAPPEVTTASPEVTIAPPEVTTASPEVITTPPKVTTAPPEFETTASPTTERPEYDLIQLVDGGKCHGMVEVLAGGNYEKACNYLITDREVMVICKQLGCDPVGARRVDPILFEFSEEDARYSPFNYKCRGNEESLSNCSPFEAEEVCAEDADSAIAIICGGVDIRAEQLTTTPANVTQQVDLEGIGLNNKAITIAPSLLALGLVSLLVSVLY